MPGATNVQVVRRRELFDLTREGMNRGHVPFRRRILGLMDHLLLLEPVERLRAYGAVDVFEGASLLQLAAVDKDGPSPGVRGKPIQHRAASFQTGPYNHLGHPERPALGSLHLRVLVERAAAAGRPFAVLLASPETTAETGLLMRVFRALGESGAGIDLLVLFFGTPEEMERSVGGRPQTTFFGDNFACPAVRCLFAPFSEAEVVFALQRAAAVFDTAYGGTVERLAERLRLQRVFTVAADGRYAERENGRALPGNLDSASMFSEEVIRGRDRKIDRRAEKALLQRLEAVVRPAA